MVYQSVKLLVLLNLVVRVFLRWTVLLYGSRVSLSLAGMFSTGFSHDEFRLYWFSPCCFPGYNLLNIERTTQYNYIYVVCLSFSLCLI